MKQGGAMLCRSVILAILAARFTLAQTPPSIADLTVRSSLTTADPVATLARARVKLAAIARSLPRYTCLETIERSYYSVPVKKAPVDLNAQQSCERKEFGKNGPLSLAADDRLRLEVAVAETGEIHSWVAATRFDSRSLFEMVTSGPISSGSFGTYLIDIFENPGARFKFIGQKTENSREILEYSFVVPVEASHYRVRIPDGMKTTGYRGGFQIDASTADLARLTEETDELPPEGHMCRANTAIDYHTVPIGSGQLLIPRRSELRTLSPNASETQSVTTYSACHEYAAESSLRFDDADDAASASKSPIAGALALPPGVSIALALLTPIDAATAAAGDPVSAKVLKPVHAKDSKDILIPAGAIAHGRLLQLRHQHTTSQFLISMAFDTLEVNGAVSPIAIQLEKDLKAETRNEKEIRSRLPGVTLPVSTNEKGGLFTVPAKNGYVMPTGFESTWITLAK
jgi:hypothetical protein